MAHISGHDRSQTLLFPESVDDYVDPDTDRACEKWMADYDIPGVDGLALHHLYRAMAWLGEELPADQQAGATPFAPRTVKDLVEEQLFERRDDLFSELSVVFMEELARDF